MPAPDPSTGLAACLDYHLRSLASAQHCTIKASKLGSFVIIAAKIQGSATPSTQLTLTCPDTFRQQDNSHTIIPCEPWDLDGNMVAKYSMLLESQLVLPLIKAYYAEARQSLPSGLFGLRGGLAALPAELLTCVLGFLDVRISSHPRLKHCSVNEPSLSCMDMICFVPSALPNWLLSSSRTSLGQFMSVLVCSWPLHSHLPVVFTRS